MDESQRDERECINFHDLDPISLEKISELRATFVYTKDGKTYRYDTWMWLEYLFTAPDCKHPLFRDELDLQTKVNIHDACKHDLDTYKDIDIKRQNLLEKCQSTQIIKEKNIVNGQVQSIRIQPVSPLYVFEICNVIDKFNTEDFYKKCKIQCTAKIEYELLNHNNEIIKKSILYV